MEFLANKLPDVVIKLGFFFMIVFMNNLVQIAFKKNVEEKKNKFSYSPITYIPLFQGIILPIITIILFSFPIGFTRNYKETLSHEIQNFPSKIFSLGIHFIFNFVMVIILCLVLKVNPALEKDSLFLILFINPLVINLIFVIMNALPIYPGFVGYYVMSFFQDKLKVSLTYRMVSAMFLFILLFSGGLFWFIKKIDFYLSYMLKANTTLLIVLTILLTCTFSIIVYLYKSNLKKYHKNLKKSVEKLLNEKEDI